MGTTKAAIEANNGTHCLRKRIEKFPLIRRYSKARDYTQKLLHRQKVVHFGTIENYAQLLFKRTILHSIFFTISSAESLLLKIQYIFQFLQIAGMNFSHAIRKMTTSTEFSVALNFLKLTKIFTNCNIALLSSNLEIPQGICQFSQFTRSHIIVSSQISKIQNHDLTLFPLATISIV